LLQVSNLSLQFTEEPLFQDVHFSLPTGAKVGLVGPNGSGKSSLLRLLAGLSVPQTGSILVPGDCRRLYLGPDLEGSVGEILDPVFFRAASRLAALEADLTESRLDAYAAALEAFEELGGWSRLARWRGPLRETGLEDLLDDPQRSGSTLSGGERSRLALARLLGAQAEVLLLDEPSASLDRDGLAHLERFLQSTPATVVLVSHDRRLLDRTTCRTLALDPIARTLTEYGGSYSFCRARRQEEERRAWREFEDQQRRVRRLEEAARGLRDHARSIEATSQNDFYRGVAKGVAAKARARQGRIQRMLADENRKEKPRRTERMRLRLAPPRLSGVCLLKARGLRVCREARPVLRGVDLEIMAGRRIALVGANGAGKSTLLAALTDQLPAQGQLWRRKDLKIGSLEQTAANLQDRKSALEALREVAPMEEGEARTFLHRFLLTGFQTLRPLSTLSDGQRMRVALALLMAAEPDLLVLDEPTAHLDLDTVEALEEALGAFPGAILAVSHDREFLERLAPDQTWVLEEGVLVAEWLDEAPDQASRRGGRD